MYYHAIVETTEKNKQGHYDRCYELDCKDIHDINELIVQPYLRNEQIYINGRYIDRQKIRLLKIKSSERPLAELRDIPQLTVSPNVLFVYSTIRVLESSEYVTDVTTEILKSAGGILKPSLSDANSSDILKTTGGILKTTPPMTYSSPVEKDKVFIVHGRDDLAKIEVARFIEKLGLTAVILHEQASSGKTIIEKIEANTNVGFAIVLYTPCDIGGLVGNNDQKHRARQNVVFEHGYLISKLGRQNVCALVKGNIETPNDISGVVYISLDNSGGWQFSVAKEMRNSGYAIDMNKVV